MSRILEARVMHEITKCAGDGCPLRDNCYRYTCEPDPLMQHWFKEIPYDERTETCDHQSPLLLPQKKQTPKAEDKEKITHD